MTGKKKVVYDDFGTATSVRSYELTVGERSLFVNAGWLAELSPFFSNLCFGEYADPQRADLPDKKYEEVLELMRAIFECPVRKPIDDSNVALLLRLSHELEVRSLMERCEAHVVKSIGHLDRHRLFELAKTLARCDKKSDVMQLLIARLALLHRPELQGFSFDEMPGDVVAEIFEQKLLLRHNNKCYNKCNVM